MGRLREEARQQARIRQSTDSPNSQALVQRRSLATREEGVPSTMVQSPNISQGRIHQAILAQGQSCPANTFNAVAEPSSNASPEVTHVSLDPHKVAVMGNPPLPGYHGESYLQPSRSPLLPVKVVVRLQNQLQGGHEVQERLPIVATKTSPNRRVGLLPARQHGVGITIAPEHVELVPAVGSMEAVDLDHDGERVIATSRGRASNHGRKRGTGNQVSALQCPRLETASQQKRTAQEGWIPPSIAPVLRSPIILHSKSTTTRLSGEDS